MEKNNAHPQFNSTLEKFDVLLHKLADVVGILEAIVSATEPDEGFEPRYDDEEGFDSQIRKK